MKIIFKETRTKRYHLSPEGKFFPDEEYDLDETIAGRLIEDYPKNFIKVPIKHPDKPKDDDKFQPKPQKTMEEEPHKMVTEEKPKTYKKGK